LAGDDVVVEVGITELTHVKLTEQSGEVQIQRKKKKKKRN
jgi:hypothetical protein